MERCLFYCLQILCKLLILFSFLFLMGHPVTHNNYVFVEMVIQCIVWHLKFTCLVVPR